MLNDFLFTIVVCDGFGFFSIITLSYKFICYFLFSLFSDNDFTSFSRLLLNLSPSQVIFHSSKSVSLPTRMVFESQFLTALLRFKMNFSNSLQTFFTILFYQKGKLIIIIQSLTWTVFEMV